MSSEYICLKRCAISGREFKQELFNPYSLESKCIMIEYIAMHVLSQYSVARRSKLWSIFRAYVRLVSVFRCCRVPDIAKAYLWFANVFRYCWNAVRTLCYCLDIVLSVRTHGKVNSYNDIHAPYMLMLRHFQNAARHILIASYGRHRPRVPGL